MNKKLVFALMIISLLGGNIYAQEAKKDAAKATKKDAPDVIWKSSVGLSLVTVSGNAKTETLSISGDTTRKGGGNKLEVNLGTVYGKNDGEKTAEYWYGKAKYDDKFTKKAYFFGQFNSQGNKLSGYDYRLSAYPGVGYHFLENRHNLIGEVGPGYLYEKRINAEDLSFVSGRAYTKYLWKITKTSEFSQDVEYLHDFDMPDGYRVNTKTSLTAKISDLISLKLGMTVQYVNSPPVGNKNTDVFTSTSLVFTF